MPAREEKVRRSNRHIDGYGGFYSDSFAISYRLSFLSPQSSYLDILARTISLGTSTHQSASDDSLSVFGHHRRHGLSLYICDGASVAGSLRDSASKSHQHIGSPSIWLEVQCIHQDRRFIIIVVIIIVVIIIVIVIVVVVVISSRNGRDAGGYSDPANI